MISKHLLRIYSPPFRLCLLDFKKYGDLLLLLLSRSSSSRLRSPSPLPPSPSPPPAVEFRQSEGKEGTKAARSRSCTLLLHSVREQNKKCIEETKRGTKGIKKVISICRMALAQYMFKLIKQPLLLLRNSK